MCKNCSCKELTQEERFEKLFLDYFSYIYEFEIGHKNDFKPEKIHYFVNRESFKQDIQEMGSNIMEWDGY